MDNREANVALDHLRRDRMLVAHMHEMIGRGYRGRSSARRCPESRNPPLDD